MEDIKIIVGRKVKAIRLEKRLTQKQLGELTGLHQNYISEIENGKRNITIEILQNIAISLKISVSILFINDSPF